MKTPLLITLSATSVALIALLAMIYVSGRDITPFLIAIPAVIGAVGGLFGIQSVNKKLETVRGQTNGTLSALRDELAQERAENKALRTVATPEQVATAVNENTITRRAFTEILDGE